MPSWTSLSRPAHHPGERDRAAVVGDQQRVVAQLAILAVERGQALPLAREAYDDRAPQPVGVEGVQRVAELEHDVVRDVDDVVDRALPGGLQPLLHPARRGPDADALDDRRDVARAEVRVVDRHGGGVLDGLVALGVVVVREAQLRAEDGSRLARDADHVHHVGPVRPGVHVQHHVAEVVGERRAHRRIRRQLEDALVLVGEPQLALGQHHPRGLDAANARGLEGRGLAAARVDQRGALAREGDALSGGDVRRAADDGVRLARAVLDRREDEAVGVGVRIDREHLGDRHELAIPAADALDALDLRRGHRQPLRERLDVEVVREVDVVAQPLEGDEHPAGLARTGRAGWSCHPGL